MHAPTRDTSAIDGAIDQALADKRIVGGVVLVMQDGQMVYRRAAGLADHLPPEPGDEHPFVQPFTGVAERCVPAQTLTGAEPVERDGEIVDAGE